MWWEGVYGRWVGVNFSKVCLVGLIGATRSWGSVAWSQLEVLVRCPEG